jgi:hypothetical protein
MALHSFDIGGTMNAANITHGLKLAGGNTKMCVGVLVIAILFAMTLHWLSDEANRQHIQRGFFG